MTKTFDADQIVQLEEELRLVKGMLEAVTNNPTVAFIVCNVDHTVVYVNETFEDMFGWKRSDVLRRELPIVPARLAAEFRELLHARNLRVDAYETWKRRQDGSEFIASESVFPLQYEGERLQYYACIIRDITQRKQEERKLKESEQRFKSLFDQNPDIVFSLDPEGRFTSANPAVERITGYKPEELLGHLVSEVITVERIDELRHYFFETMKGQTFTLESALIHKNGSRVEINISLLPIKVEEEVIGVYCIAKDITHRKKSEALINYMAYHDSLTELPNRRMFQEHAVAELRKAQEQGHKLALLLLDLDGFKRINDYHGHGTGDFVLHLVATRIRQTIGEDHLAARMGGDEFTILLNSYKDEDEVIGFANRLLDELNQPMICHQIPLHVSPSIGIALYPEHGESLETLYKHADQAMYGVKQTGKNGVQLYRYG